MWMPTFAGSIPQPILYTIFLERNLFLLFGIITKTTFVGEKMNWYTIAARMSTMTVEEALSILDLSFGATKEEIVKQRNKLAIKYHPDISGPESHEKMVEVNTAYDKLKEVDFETSRREEKRRTYRERDETWKRPPYNSGPWYKENPPKKREGHPPWETDRRSSYWEVGKDFSNLNYCKKTIYEEAIKHGDVEEYTISAFDGSFFRGMFSVNANQQALGLAGKAMEIWNGSGNPYATTAVFAWKKVSKKIQLIREYGKDVSDKNEFYQHGFFDTNPDNDQVFINFLRKKFPFVS